MSVLASIFPKTTTANPPTLDDYIVFVAVQPGCDPEPIARRRREILDELGGQPGTQTALPDDFLYADLYIEEVLYARYPNIDVQCWEYFLTRDDLVPWLMPSSKTDDKEEKRKVEILRPYLALLSNYVAYPWARRHNRAASKIRQNFEYRSEPYDAVPGNSLSVRIPWERHELPGNDLRFVNRCNISLGPVYAVNLVFNQIPNGKKEFMLLFDDEKCYINLTEQDAQLLHRFFNDTPDDVLDLLENERVQEIIRNALKAIEARDRVLETVTTDAEQCN